MEQYIKIYFDGKPYEVPGELTIMTAMEYAGYRLVRGCGCRHGFCGACATIYRIEGKNPVHFCLACQTQVEEGMYVATLPFFPLDKRTYALEELKPDDSVMMKFFPEIYACVACNSCTKSCSKKLNTMQYIAFAQRAEYVKCAKESFDCVMCGICSSRCPAGISHPQVGLLSRRLYGKYIASPSAHTIERVRAIENGEFDALLEELMGRPVEEIKELYNSREIEK